MSRHILAAIIILTSSLLIYIITQLWNETSLSFWMQFVVFTSLVCIATGGTALAVIIAFGKEGEDDKNA